MAYQDDRITSIPAPLPKDYDRGYSFTDFQTINPGKPASGAALDNEFANIEQALDETQARARLIQRDDGALANSSVGLEQLKPESYNALSGTGVIQLSDITSLSSLNTAALVDGQQFSVDGVIFKWTGSDWEVISGYIKLSIFGVTSASAGSEVRSALADAAEYGVPVLVDGMYNYEGLAISPSVSSVELFSFDKNQSGFNLQTTASTILTPAAGSHTKIRDLTFTNGKALTDPISVLVSPTPSVRVKSITFENCIYSGRVRSLDVTGPTEQDPSTNPFGADLLVYRGNTVDDVETSHVRVSNYPIARTEVDHNRVNNFSFSFFACQIENGATNETAVRDGNELFLVSDNELTNDIDFWPDLTGAAYYVFVLLEGVEVQYHDNKISGMKCEQDVSLQDAYLSCITVRSHDNEWRNNVRFATGVTDRNYLVKCKEDGVSGVPESRSLKDYRNNTYKIDAEWVTAVGKTLADAMVSLFDVSRGCDFKFDNNSIDVTYLSLKGANQDTRSWYVANNEIKAIGAATSGWLLIGSRQEENTDGAEYTSKNNTVSFSGISLGGASSNVYQSAVNPAYGRPTLTIEGDIVEIDDTGGSIISNIQAESITHKNCHYSGGWTYPEFNVASKSKARDAVTYITKGSNIRGLEGWATSGSDVGTGGQMINQYRMLGSTDAFYWNIYSDTAETIEQDVNYRVTLGVVAGSDYGEVSFSYELTYDDIAEEYTVNWTTSGDTARSDVLRSDAGTNSTIKIVEGPGNLSSSITATFINGSDEGYFRFNGLPAGAAAYTIKSEAV